MFFSWMSATAVRNTCTAVTASDVYTALSSYSASPTNSTQLSELNMQIQQLQQTLKQKEEDASIANARAEQMVRPELNASYYDGWFPLGRPLKRPAVPILIFFASLLLSASFFILLGIIGIRSHFFVVIPDIEAMGGLSKPMIGLIGVTVLLFGLTIYAFTR